MDLVKQLQKFWIKTAPVHRVHKANQALHFAVSRLQELPVTALRTMRRHGWCLRSFYTSCYVPLAWGLTHYTEERRRTVSWDWASRFSLAESIFDFGHIHTFFRSIGIIYHWLHFLAEQLRHIYLEKAKFGAKMAAGPSHQTELMTISATARMERTSQVRKHTSLIHVYEFCEWLSFSARSIIAIEPMTSCRFLFQARLPARWGRSTVKTKVELQLTCSPLEWMMAYVVRCGSCLLLRVLLTLQRPLDAVNRQASSSPCRALLSARGILYSIPASMLTVCQSRSRLSQ